MNLFGLDVQPIVAGRPYAVGVGIDDETEGVFAGLEMGKRDGARGGECLLLQHVAFLVGELDEYLSALM